MALYSRIKKTIKGKVYDTKTAKELMVRDFNGTLTTIYCTPRGNLFACYETCTIKPLNEAEAKRLIDEIKCK